MVYKEKTKKYIYRGKNKKVTKNARGGAPDQIATSTVPVRPTILSNLKEIGSIGAQVVNMGAKYGIDTVAKIIGTNPNESLDSAISDIANSADSVKNALQSPAGQKILNSTAQIVSEVGENVIAPAIVDTGNTIIEKSGQVANKVVSAGIDALSATPLAPIIEIPKFVGDVSSASMKVGEAVSNVVGIGADTVEKMNEKKQEAQGVLAEFKSLLNNGSNMINEGVASGLNVAQNITDKATNYVNTNAQQITNEQTPASLQQLQKGGKILAKRIYNSQNEFLNPHIYVQGGGNIKTRVKRHYKTRKLTRRHRHNK
jgi:hypothetical protein